MSLHAISSEAEAAIRRQRKSNLISSAIISFLTVVMIMLTFSLFLLNSVTTHTGTTDGPTVYIPHKEVVIKTPPTRTSKVKTKPSAPSHPVPVIVTSLPTDLSIINPPIDFTTPSIEIGMGNDFIGNADGFDQGPNSGPKFFDNESSAERVAYVIDYSLSMNGKGRLPLMKAELSKSISQLNHDLQYQLIFFAGPCWIAGDEVAVNGRGQSSAATIKHKGKTFEWTGNGAHEWKLKDERQEMARPTWLKARRSQLDKSLEIIEETPLKWGTAWSPAIEMALNMDPAPQVIFFMTDGDAGPNSVEIAEELAKKAAAKNVIINTVALMEPKAEKAMSLLADKTGGKFTMVGADGKPVKKAN